MSLDNIGIKPECGPGQGKADWLRRKLDAAVRHLREIEDFNRIGDFPPGTYEGSFQEAQADRARSIYEQITSDFYEGKLGQPTMRQERDAALEQVKVLREGLFAIHGIATYVWNDEQGGPEAEIACIREMSKAILFPATTPTEETT